MSSSFTVPQRPLGGSAKHLQVGQIALGLMGMTWCEPSKYTADSQAFDAIKVSVDAGSNFLNAGAFYGPPQDNYANLKLLRRFFDAFPEYKQRVVLSVKGGIPVDAYREKGMAGMRPDASIEHLENDLVGIRQALGTDEGGKTIDVYEMARVDPNVPIRQAMSNLLALSSQTYKDSTTGETKRGKGLFDHIALSEIGLETIQSAIQVAPIACIEIEMSPWERFAKDSGIVDFCQQHQLPILAYSPLGMGILAGKFQSVQDLQHLDDLRKHQDKFQPENFEKNLQLANAFRQAADQRSTKTTAAQLVLAWLIRQSSSQPSIIIPIPGTSYSERVKENVEAAALQLDDQDFKQIETILATYKPHGGRYNATVRTVGSLWA